MSLQDLENADFCHSNVLSHLRDTAPHAPSVIFRASVENLAKDQGLVELVASGPCPPAFPSSPQGSWAIPIDWQWRENTQAALSHGLSYKP